MTRKVKFLVGGKVVAESESFSIENKPEDEVLRAIGVPMTKEELAEFRKQWEESLQGGSGRWQVKEKEPKQKAQDMN